MGTDYRVELKDDRRGQYLQRLPQGKKQKYVGGNRGWGSKIPWNPLVR